ncbi:putative prenylated rab acceptor PRA1 [Medicago truncatula]|uniref:PRA1 family protein n=1 Tax=Medicago truncatula TaxID=3880 RepID=A2Q469_MEDTR|nr:PRA1 family protein F2 [Medicago truncatula]ABN08419.1 Prenylated rab acceptor PRA1 [Medicago truncatula]AES67873.1 PRA1 (prenylated RAB acceptor) family protein [Medicago truncatula]RHN76291.1 putative prenylated rab acceptor PRA1 [Medicago truncatula]
MTTTYGTIPTPLSPLQTNLQLISRTNESIKFVIGTRRPWKLFFNVQSFNLPRNFNDAISRYKINICFFEMNYTIILVIILFLSLLFHPTSLIVFLELMASWLFLYFLRDEPFTVFGRLISDRVVVFPMLILTVVFILFIGTIFNIFVAVFMCVVIVLHAAFRNTNDYSIADLFIDEEDVISFSPPNVS